MESFENNLVQDFNEGSEQAFNEVYTLYHRQLCFYAQRLSLGKEDSEDVVSATFIAMFQTVQKGKRFESQKHIKDFLYLATHNAAINHIQHTKRQSGYMKDFLKVAEPQEDDAYNQRVEAEMMQMIFDAVEGLPTECKRIFKMVYIEELNYQDIAAKMGLSPQTIRNQRSRAIQLLRNRILKQPTMAIAGLSMAVLSFSCLSGWLLLLSL